LVIAGHGPAQLETEHRAVLQARLAKLGPEDPGTLASRNNLALVLHDLGRLSEAENEHRIAHEARERTLSGRFAATYRRKLETLTASPRSSRSR
jgi:hypothetical protein